MARKTTWKSLNLTNEAHLRSLQSVIGNSRGTELWHYTTVIEGGVGTIETNMPHTVLRVWFRAAGVPLPNEYVIADRPYWCDSTPGDFDEDRKLWDEYGVPPSL